MRNFHFAGRSTVHAQNAMVATSHPLAALTAVDVLRAGGTAADAAVAACALLGVIEPQSTGIGGDCFALCQPKGEGKIVAYNGSGRAPMAAKAEWYLERKINSVPLTSAHAVSIPGAVDAWDVILRDHGKIGLDTLLQPAIKAAEEGYIVAPRIAFDWKNQFEKLKNGTNTERYLLPGGKPAVAGDIIHQPELGKTLRAIAAKGRDAFYSGEIAADMVETLRGIGGLHTLEDFAAHSTETTAPIGTMYKGYDAWQCPPNGPGITMLVMLNILSHFDLTKFAPVSVERFHIEAEAARIAYMMREEYIGDPAAGRCRRRPHPRERFRRRACQQDQDGSHARSAQRRAADEPVDDLCHRRRQGPQRLLVHQFDRACLWLGDRLQQDRRAAAKPRRRFPHPAGPPQLHRAGQAAAAHHHPRPATKGGRAVMPFGVMGGQYQPVGQCHVLTNILDYGCDVQEAIDMPRGLHYEGVYQLEDSVPAEVVEGLKKLGHKTTSIVGPLGGGQAIWIDWDKGTLTGGSDPRKDGCALGY